MDKVVSGIYYKMYVGGDVYLRDKFVFTIGNTNVRSWLQGEDYRSKNKKKRFDWLMEQGPERVEEIYKDEALREDPLKNVLVKKEDEIKMPDRNQCRHRYDILEKSQNGLWFYCLFCLEFRRFEKPRNF